MEYKFAENYLDDAKVKWEPMRNGAGKGMEELGGEKEDMIVLGADTAGSTRASYFAEKYPERFVQCGVAEQNLIGVAAGLAYQGKVPYAVTYAPFLIGRPWEPIRTLLGYSERHVILVGSHAGIATGSDGPTHQMTEDIALIRCIPGFTLISPCDSEQARKAVKAAYDEKGPVYVRNAREGTPVFTTEDTPFEIGKAQVLREGTDVTAIGTGYPVHRLLQIAEEMKDTLSIEVINLHTIKPIDEETIINSAKKTGKVFTVEDHVVAGGMGSAVAEVLAQKNPVPMRIHGLYDTFAESGTAKNLWVKYGLDKEGIAKALKELTQT